MLANQRRMPDNLGEVVSMVEGLAPHWPRFADPKIARSADPANRPPRSPPSDYFAPATRFSPVGGGDLKTRKRNGHIIFVMPTAKPGENIA